MGNAFSHAPDCRGIGFDDAMTDMPQPQRFDRLYLTLNVPGESPDLGDLQFLCHFFNLYNLVLAPEGQELFPAL